MLFKYHFVMEKLENNFSSVENSFMNHLKEFPFIDTVDYDGEFVTLLISDQSKGEAIQREAELNAKMNSLITSFKVA